MKQKYADIIDSLEIEDDDIYDAVCDFEEYCEECKIPPVSFKAQLQYLFTLKTAEQIRQAVDTTILKSWKSITYAVDNMTVNVASGRAGNFTDTSKSTFTPKRV